MSEPLFEDPVVAEVHAVRAQMLAECGGDYEKFMEQVRERQRASGRKVIPAPPATAQRMKQPGTPIFSPRLLHPEQTADFVKEVSPENTDAGL